MEFGVSLSVYNYLIFINFGQVTAGPYLSDITCRYNAILIYVHHIIIASA